MDGQILNNACPDIIKGRHIYLSLPKSEDIPQIYKWETDIKIRPMWQDNNNLPSPFLYTNEFARKIENAYHTFFLSKSLTSQKNIGCVYSYNYNRIDGFIHITVFMDEQLRNGFLGAEAGVLFCEYLFKYFPLRKIYCVAFAYNKESTSILEQAGFSREGVFKEHKYFNGKYHDMYTYAIYREEITKLTRYIH